MKINGVHYRSIWAETNGNVAIIDQTQLPHRLVIQTLSSLDDIVKAIRDMQVRGAPLIGATAAYGICLALRQNCSDASLEHAVAVLAATRPTAINLRWALDQMRHALQNTPPAQRVEQAYQWAAALCEADVAVCAAIGRHGLELIQAIAARKPAGQPVNILTHCNAGWLATVDWGTATAPMYQAHEAGIPIHVWVDETRPRNQGAALTAFELGHHGINHTLIVDNAGGHLMQHGQVDLCIVGTDRTTASGDVANKIGTYLKALAAKDNGVPFYVALPSATIDWTLDDGARDIPIEQRAAEEVLWVNGQIADGSLTSVRIAPDHTAAANYGFDVTPARLISGLITERGIAAASREGLQALFPKPTTADQPASH